MLGIRRRLLEREALGKPIQVSIIGAGQMGRGMVSQTMLMKGMIPSVVVDINLEAAKNALLNANVPEGEIKVAKTIAEANDYLRAGKYVVTEDHTIATGNDVVTTVVDATGVTEIGARIAVDSIAAKKHIVMLNVEADVVVGPLLYKKAQEAGVIYTGSAGDEPGAVMELYDFADSLGFDVRVIGKGKNNKVDLTSNPDSVVEEAKSKSMNPKMLTAFKDGTKTMVEMTAMSNATGYLPDVLNGHGHHATVSELPGLYRLQSEGGILSNYGVVDYINGVAPGVYVIVSSPLPEVHHEMKYLSMGDGPNYVLFRPYHLCSLETPMSVARLELFGEPTIVPMAGAPYSETVTLAKKDMKAGEYLDGIGAYTVYGGFYPFKEAQAKRALPLGLVNKKTRLKADVQPGQLITYDMVELDESSFIYQLRKEQDELLAKGQLL